jgi:hypothetical protein
LEVKDGGGERGQAKKERVAIRYGAGCGGAECGVCFGWRRVVEKSDFEVSAREINNAAEFDARPGVIWGRVRV